MTTPRFAALRVGRGARHKHIFKPVKTGDRRQNCKLCRSSSIAWSNFSTFPTPDVWGFILTPISRAKKILKPRIAGLNYKMTDILAEKNAGGFDAVFIAIGVNIGKKTTIPARAKFSMRSAF